MPYPLIALISVMIFALVHLWAEKTRRLDQTSHGIFLSAGGGIAISYVFIDLLPKLGKSNLMVQQALKGVFPYFERHVYVMALAGFLLFFIVNRTENLAERKSIFWLSISSYALFNFFVGYAVADPNNTEVQPLVLFTIALGLHLFLNDYTLNKTQGKAYNHTAKWILILSLFLGWLAGLWFTLSQTAIALVSAFIGGGVIMNVTRHELPTKKPQNLSAFLFSSLIYTSILLIIGS